MTWTQILFPLGEVSKDGLTKRHKGEAMHSGEESQKIYLLLK